ncbi:MAG: sulfite exporter TauE/SafE family protein [Candidatus Pacebacteria bacterium CG10_big_fil_rev_8_21_14_0_10_56_10]|nr:MAG: sulfite exporter TauE/SafE family protein [Candidatus Pacebacteria bacterium CG10_big_fil_rev_8_21_14_0_10_56_10]
MVEIFYLTLLTFTAAAVGTMTGFGTSTIMVPVLSLFLPLPTVLLFVGVVHWFGDIWKMLFFKKGFNWRLILLFVVPGVVLSFLAARLPLTLPEELLQRWLGLFLVAYVSFLFFRPSWKVKPSTAGAVWGGSLSGFFAGVFGVGGAIRSTFLSAFDIKKSVFLFTSGMISWLIDSSRISQYWLSVLDCRCMVYSR